MLGGVRDRGMLHLTYGAGLRVSELMSLRVADFPDRSLATVRILGKGRRERVLPLWRETQAALRAWLVARPDATPPELFPNPHSREQRRPRPSSEPTGHGPSPQDAPPPVEPGVSPPPRHI